MQPASHPANQRSGRGQQHAPVAKPQERIALKSTVVPRYVVRGVARIQQRAPQLCAAGADQCESLRRAGRQQSGCQEVRIDERSLAERNIGMGRLADRGARETDAKLLSEVKQRMAGHADA